jgi:hypothetical protein
MDVAIANEQHDLKKEHTGRPYRWATAEPGEDDFADQRLHLKKEKRAEKDRRDQNERNSLLGDSLWFRALGCRTLS